MTTCIALVHKEPDSCFGVSFPDIPGCIAAGDTLEEAISAGAEALRFYAEDTPMPPLRSLDEIEADPEIRKELQNGALLVAIPWFPNEDRITRINVTLPQSLLAGIDLAAKASGMSRSAFLAQAARERLAGYQPPSHKSGSGKSG